MELAQGDVQWCVLVLAAQFDTVIATRNSEICY